MRITRRQMLARTGRAAALCLGASVTPGMLFASAATSPGDAEARGNRKLFPAEDLEFLRGLTQAVVEAARVRPGAKRDNSQSNGTGATLIMPGGHYPAYWLRDFAMSLDSGAIAPEEMRHHLLLAAQCQNGPFARHLKRGLIIPPHALPDHINFDGTAAFYPGSYATGEDQGDGSFGILPPVDDHYEFIHIAHRLYRATRQADFLHTEVAGLRMLARLIKAFEAPRTDPVTGLVATDAARRAVGFGFCDSIYFTGSLLFPSLLRYRAAGQLLELIRASGEKLDPKPFRTAQAAIAKHLPRVFGEPKRLDGWLMAATEVGRQADVWGTLYALHLGALGTADARRARRTVVAALERGDIAYEGAVRHVPHSLDASPTSAWERAGCGLNTYQNGAYWHTPTGWLIEAVRPVSPDLARGVFADYVRHLRKGDFRQGGDHHAPWECFGRDGKAAQNGIYMTSVALPLPVVESLAKERRPNR